MTPGPEAPALRGLPALVAPDCRVLVLGSFPGEASLKAQQYYGHPRNLFWPMLLTLLPNPAGLTMASCYEKRSAWLLSHGLGLWDVYGACNREGSLDANIKHAVLNDLRGLRERCPSLQAVLHNGSESHRHHRHTQALGLPVHKLPSTSPANAATPTARKRAQWREVLGLYVTLACP